MQIITLKHVFNGIYLQNAETCCPRKKDNSDSNRGWMHMHVENHHVLIQPPQRDCPAYGLDRNGIKRKVRISGDMQ